ncbi:MAG: type I methionyl aminopeptidase [Deferribacterota bacterium]|nr:type I methionyl aminopeptidase [Deferribacterota bacterium]
MIIVKSIDEIKIMERTGEILKSLFKRIEDEKVIKKGATTKSIDKFIEKHIYMHSAYPSFKGYRGFPASSCISINDTVVHGIPSDYTLKEGDIISIDVGAYRENYHADAARTYIVGYVEDKIMDFVNTAKEAFFKGIEMCYDGKRIGDISNKIQRYVETKGYSVIRDFFGHGIGKNLHEDPMIPNYGKGNRGAMIKNGMTLAIEPMISMGSSKVIVEDDGWTARTMDGSLAAHYENTVAIVDNGPVILT